MLVLSRRLNQTLIIGDTRVTIVRIGDDAVKLGITAAPEIDIVREELLARGPWAAPPRARSHQRAGSGVKSCPPNAKANATCGANTYCSTRSATASIADAGCAETAP
jgi:carbon storage regulator CsrA